MVVVLVMKQPRSRWLLGLPFIIALHFSFGIYTASTVLILWYMYIYFTNDFFNKLGFSQILHPDFMFLAEFLHVFIKGIPFVTQQL